MKRKVFLLMILALMLVVAFASCSNDNIDEETIQNIIENVIDKAEELSDKEILENENASEGLEFISNYDGTCSVSGIGTCTDTSLVIPTYSPAGDQVICIDDYAFCKCTTITSVEILEGVQTIGKYAFYGCKNLLSVNIPENIVTIGNSSFYDCTSLKSVIFTSTQTYKLKATIETEAFYNCSSLNSIVIPKTFNTIGANAFGACEKLEEIELPFVGETGTNTYSSGTNTWFGYIFADVKTNDINSCVPSLLKKVTITSGSTIISSAAFSNCTQITSIILASSTLKTIGDKAFQNCTGLTTISLPQNLEGIGQYAFDSCSNLKSIVIPENVNSIGFGIFNNCNNLQNITIPYLSCYINYSSYTNIGCLFGNRYNNTKIPESLKTITITKDSTIFSNAFSDCSSITSIILSSSVTEVNLYGFQNCNNLSSITYMGTKQQWENVSISGTSENITPSIVHCLDGDTAFY